jgi:hypothetical protein
VRETTVSVRDWADEKLAKIPPICEAAAREAQEFAKANGAWEDRTGSARKMLKGFAILPNKDKNVSGKDGFSFTVSGGDNFGFAVAHRVNYGFWLETANNGKYAILEKAVNSAKAQFIENVRAVMNG